jgi:ABC-type transport system involved in multi-copper enzyme maturation permease subunit
MPSVGFDGPSVAIIRREVERLMQERGIRVLIPIMLGVNALIAYSLLSIPEGFANLSQSINFVVSAQWMSVYAIGLVLIAGRAGTSITTERSRDTWTLLRTTPAGPVELVLGHMGAALASAAILAISQLPILVIMTLCAEDATQQLLVFGFAVGLSSWVTCAAWSVWMSARFRHTTVALGTTVAAAIWAIGYLPVVIAQLVIDIVRETGVSWMVLGHIVDMFQLLSPVHQISSMISTGGNWSSVGTHLAVMLANAIIPIYMAARDIRRESDPTLPVSSKPEKKRRFTRSAKPTKAFEFDEAHSIYGLERLATKNDGGVLGRLAFALIALYFLAGAFFAGSSVRNDPEILIAMYFVFMSLTIWRSAIMVATNRELEAFNMIAMTGLRSHEIVRDLARACAASLAPIFVLLMYTVIAGLCGIYFFETPFDSSALFYVGAFCTTLMLCMAMQLTCGLFSSIVGKGTREAVVLSVLLAFIVNFGVPLLWGSALWSVQETLRNNLFGIPEMLGMASPSLQFNIELTVGCTTPFFGLLAILDDGTEIPPYAWFVSMGVGLTWACVWYASSVWLMRRRLLAQKV